MTNLMTLLTKRASIGSDEQEFEKAFSNLAYTYLRDKAPRLIDSLVGFQLVDRNEDNTKAAGVFGFLVGNQWLYAPVFFLNGDLKGHELLYMKKSDNFVPLDEKWVNYILSRRPHVLGESSGARNLSDLGGQYPDIRTLSRLPSVGGGKTASDNWAAGAAALMAAAKVGQSNAFYRGVRGSEIKQASVLETPIAAALGQVRNDLDLDQVLSTDTAMFKAAYDVSQAYPMVHNGLRQFYGDDCFSRWGQALHKNVKAAAHSIIPVEEKKVVKQASNSILPVTASEEAPVNKEAKLRMYVYQSVMTRHLPELTTEEREKLKNDTVLIKDKRNDDEVSGAYNRQIEAQLTNPTETALYEVLVKPGKLEKCLVTVGSVSMKGSSNNVTIVPLDDKKAYTIANRLVVYANEVSDREEWNDWFDSLSDASSVSKDKVYVALNNRGESTFPFTVRDDLGDGRYAVCFQTRTTERAPSPTYTPPTLGDDCSGLRLGEFDWGGVSSNSDARISIDTEGRRGTRLRHIGDELRIPANFKVVPLGETCCDWGIIGKPRKEKRTEILQLGNPQDIQMLFHEKTARLKLTDNGGSVYVDSARGQQELTKRAALLSLVSDHGLREATAREMLKAAETNRQAVYRVDYAEGYGSEKTANTLSVLAGGPSAPMNHNFGGAQSAENYGPNNAAPTQFAKDSYRPVDGLQGENTDPSVWDPWQNYQAEDFQGTMNNVQQAMQQGQKEIFDTSMISGLLKTVRQDSIVDRYLGKLMASVDALGRLLMNFYWHQEEFADRYGKTDLPDLEDSLRNAFESLGDVTLFLREKSVESVLDSGDLDLGETARN